MSLTVPLTVTAASVVVSPSAGDSIARCGGVVSSVTCSVGVLVVPPAVRRHGGQRVGALDERHRRTERLAPLTAAGTPLTVTVAFGSPTLPDTVIGLVLR